MAPSTRSTTRKAAAANTAVGLASDPATAAAASTNPRSGASADHSFAIPATAGTHDNDLPDETNEDDDNNAAGSMPDWAKSSTGVPLKTVEDDPDMVMDISGWKKIVKDQEDMTYLKQALEDVPAADISDVEVWVQQQEQAKYNKELAAHVAAVDAAPEELKNILLARSKSGIYDSIRPKKETGTSAEDVDKTDGAHTTTDYEGPSAMETN